VQAVGNFIEEPGDHFYITERDYIAGMPIEQNRRCIFVHRFRMIKGIDIDFAMKQLQECQKQMSKLLPSRHGVKREVNIVDERWQMPIYELLIYWEPALEESSRESFDRFSKIILETFDAILPRGVRTEDELQTSHDVLRIAGEVYFD